MRQIFVDKCWSSCAPAWDTRRSVRMGQRFSRTTAGESGTCRHRLETVPETVICGWDL